MSDTIGRIVVSGRVNAGHRAAGFKSGKCNEYSCTCDGDTIEQKSGNNNFAIPIERNAFDVDSTTGDKTITVGFFHQGDRSFCAVRRFVQDDGAACIATRATPR